MTEAANEVSWSYCGSWGNKEVGVNRLMCMFATVGGTQVTLHRAKARVDATYTEMGFTVHFLLTTRSFHMIAFR
jgi:hypothetical protein